MRPRKPKSPLQRALAVGKMLLERYLVPGGFVIAVMLAWSIHRWFGLGVLVLGAVLLGIFWDPLTRLHGGWTLKGRRGSLLAVQFCSEGENVRAATAAGELLEWELDSGRLLGAAPGGLHSHPPPVTSANGKLYATLVDERIVRVHDSLTGAVLAEFAGHRRAVNTMAFSQDSARFATGGSDHCVVVWNLASRRLAGVLRGHRQPVRGVAFSPDGSQLASCGDDGTVKVWQLPRLPAT